MHTYQNFTLLKKKTGFLIKIQTLKKNPRGVDNLKETAFSGHSKADALQTHGDCVSLYKSCASSNQTKSFP